MARAAIPRYCLHKASGQATVDLSGKTYYLGRHGSAASKRKYSQLIAEWNATGRVSAEGDKGPTITGVCVAYLEDVIACTRIPGGPDPKWVGHLRLAMRPLRRMYGPTPAREFGPRCLMAMQQAYVELGWCRKYVNQQVGRIRAMFKWAAPREMVPASVYHELQCVEGLRKGRSAARESTPVRPVPQPLIDAVLPLLPSPVRAIVRLQLLTGARPGELLGLRPLDLDMTGKIWMSKPLEQHKSSWRGLTRILYFGPQAQDLLRPLLARPVDTPLFSPAEAAREKRAEHHAARVTPPSCGNRPGSNRVKDPVRQPGSRYTVQSYARCITRACDAACPPPPPLRQRDDETHAEWQARLTADQKAQLKEWQKEHRWHPHQLRHNAATNARKTAGPDAARALLGQRSLVATQIYAEIDAETVQAIVSKIG